MPSGTQRLLLWLRRGPLGERIAGAGCLLVLLSMAAPWTSSSTFSSLDIGSDRWNVATDVATTGPSGAGWLAVVAMLAVAAVLGHAALRGGSSPTPAAAGLIAVLALAEIGAAVAFTANYYSYWQGYGAYYLDTVGWGVLACLAGAVLTLAGAGLMWRGARRVGVAAGA